MERAELFARLRRELGPAIESSYTGLGLALPDCVLLYGSWAWGAPNESSDIDIAALGAPMGFDEQAALSRAIKKSTPQLPWTSIELNFYDFRDVVLFRKFSQCILSKIWTGGVELWTAPEAVRAANMAEVANTELSAAEAKAEWVRSQQLKAFAVLVSGRKYNDLTDRMNAQNAFTGACFSLWALLLSAGIDPSPREFRWYPERLLEIATWIDPGLARLAPLLVQLPERFYRDSWDCGVVSEEEARKALAAAWRIYRAVKRSNRARIALGAA